MNASRCENRVMTSTSASSSLSSASPRLYERQAASGSTCPAMASSRPGPFRTRGKPCLHVREDRPGCHSFGIRAKLRKPFPHRTAHLRCIQRQTVDGPESPTATGGNLVRCSFEWELNLKKGCSVMFSHHAGTGPFTPDSDRATLRRGAGLQAALSGPERTPSKPPRA